MIFTSVSPNTEHDDIFRAWRMLFTPWRWKKGNYVAALEESFKTYFDVPHALSFQSGRNSLYAILSALNVEKDSEVLLQAYSCVAVPGPVLWAGAQPVYVDSLDDSTMSPEDLEKKITPKSKVLIIQHTFGIPAHITELLAIAKKHNLFVIEDCAHALGGDYAGQKLGMFGDAAFFSFGRDKIISSVFGGMVITRNSEFAEKVKQIRNSFAMPRLWYVKQQLVHPIIMSIAKPLYDLGIGKAIIATALKLGLISKAVEKTELDGGKPSFFKQVLPNGLAYLAFHQFQKLDLYNEHRKSIASYYAANLKKEIAKPTIAPTLFPVYLRYTILVPDPKTLISEARKNNIELGDWYTTAIAPKNVEEKSVGYNASMCPNAERLAKLSVNLPTHISISLKNVKTIVEYINRNVR
jgi:perosamine synthetase